MHMYFYGKDRFFLDTSRSSERERIFTAHTNMITIALTDTLFIKVADASQYKVADARIITKQDRLVV